MVAVRAFSDDVQREIYFCVCIYGHTAHANSPLPVEQLKTPDVDGLDRAHLVTAEAPNAVFVVDLRFFVYDADGFCGTALRAFAAADAVSFSDCRL